MIQIYSLEYIFRGLICQLFTLQFWIKLEYLGKTPQVGNSGR